MCFSVYSLFRVHICCTRCSGTPKLCDKLLDSSLQNAPAPPHFLMSIPHFTPIFTYILNLLSSFHCFLSYLPTWLPMKQESLRVPLCSPLQDVIGYAPHRYDRN